MISYIVRRLGAVVLILLGVSAITYCLLFLLPADPVDLLAGRNATPEMREALRQELGLDKPLPVQYAVYLGKLVQGDMGRSLAQKVDVSLLIAARLPATLQLMAAAIFASLLFGLPAGMYAAMRRGTVPDKAAMIASFAGVSAPQFVIGLLLLYLFAYKLGWLPMGGYGVANIILPALTVAVANGGWYSRMMRSSMIEVLTQDYMRTARAKGLPRWRAVVHHGLRNALLPIIAMVGIDMGYLITNIVIVESVFGWPGIGQLLWQGIQRLDYTIIIGVTITAAVVITLANLLADLLTPLIDPRIELR
ncbi:MAG TPA: ABC transporter permease [Verrucomicrobiae bacterium]|jgi:peptide/nickel transport system permease protein|nr:ABC transporter permease [Verrucomicrobiae bacterium]